VLPFATKLPSDRFVDLLCEANRYETVWRSDQGTHCTWIVLRKSRDEPFAPPTDVQLGEGLPEMADGRRIFRRWASGRRRSLFWPDCSAEPGAGFGGRGVAIET
jgi:hypothetical protein